MRFSFLALAGLIALGHNYGVQARAAPNDVVVSSSRANHAWDAAGAVALPDDERLKGRSPAFVPPPRPPLARPPPKKVPSKVPTDGPDGAPPGRPAGNGKGNGNGNGNGKGGDKDGQPIRLGSDQKAKPGNVCFRPGKRSRILRRAGPPWTHADLENPKRLAEWLSTQSNFDPRKAVFYVTGPYPEPEVGATGEDAINKNGKTMAENFISNNPGKGYVRYQDLFDKNPKFEEDFKFADYVKNNPNKDFVIPGSEAMALWTKEAIVFNSDPTDPGKSPLAEMIRFSLSRLANYSIDARDFLSESLWTKHEKDLLYNAEKITKMKDNALYPHQTDGTIPIPPKPPGC
jgi:hypothetical protein